MNQQNPNLQTTNGQPPPQTPQQQHHAQQQQLQLQQQQQQQQQQQVNLGHPNDIPNANWRNEVTVPDRTRFVSQL
jgi:hypothetical protein